MKPHDGSCVQSRESCNRPLSCRTWFARTSTSAWMFLLVAGLAAGFQAHIAGGQTRESKPPSPPTADPRSRGDSEQTSPQPPTIQELQDIIAKAMKNHPEVAAGRAKLLEAQANLDRVRLEVAQRIVEHHRTR